MAIGSVCDPGSIRARYPRSLEGQNIEARPVVRFRVDSAGNVVDVSLEQDTPYPAINQAAIEAVQRASCRPPAGGGARTVKVAVNFAVEGSDFAREAQRRQQQAENERRERERQAQVEQERRQRERDLEAQRQRDEEQRQREVERRQRQEEQQRLDEEQRQREEEQRRLDEEQRQREEEQRRLDEEQRQREEEQRRLDEEQRQREAAPDPGTDLPME
uniref:Energy transducer TonB n=1 Tax=Desertifilum tharense IPPAS B-1220 TaxID=1781255 RepID=A0ACD5H1S7_9CYAN